MAKAITTPRFLRCSYPGFVLFDFGFSAEINETIKQFPGVHWGPSCRRSQGWYVPFELQDRVAAAVSAKIATPQLKTLAPLPKPVVVDPRSRSHQAEFQRFTATWDNGGCWFEQGLGKSLAALVSRRGKTLIVTPAGTIETMVAQVEKWLSVPFDRYDTATKRKWSEKSKDLVLTTYSCLHDPLILSNLNAWDTVILDEAHKIKSYKSRQGKAARLLRKTFPRARFILCTGTPQSESFAEWFAYADMLWPGRFGTWQRFAGRYAKYEYVEHADFEAMALDDRPKKIVGLRDEHAEEFRERVAALGVRAVKADIKDELPPLDVVPFWCPSPIRSTADALRELTHAPESEDNFRQHMKLVSASKLRPTIDAIMDLVEEGHARIFVSGWHINFVEAVAKCLRELAPEGYEIHLTHGGGAERDAVLARANAAERAILVGTIASLCEGINALAQWPQAVIGEIHYSPLIMSQHFARLHRLDTKLPVTIRVMLMRDTLDDRIIERLSTKVEEQNKTIKLGLFEEAWQGIVASEVASTDIKEEINKVMENVDLELDEDVWFT